MLIPKFARSTIHLVLLVLVAAACGSETSSTNASVDPDQFLVQYAEASCAVFDRCAELPAFDYEVCVADAADNISQRQLGYLFAQEKAGKIELDHSAATRCLESLAEHDCLRSSGNAF